MGQPTQRATIKLDVIVSPATTGCRNVEVLLFVQFATIQERHNRSAYVHRCHFLVADFSFNFPSQMSRVSCIDNLIALASPRIMRFHVIHKIFSDVIIRRYTIPYQVHVIHNRNGDFGQNHPLDKETPEAA